MNLSEYIIKYRKEHGLSQRQFAKQCGVSNGYISMVENEANPKTGQPIKPSAALLLKLARGVGKSLDELLLEIDDATEFFDEAIVEMLAASAAPLEELSDPINALNIFLYRIGERIIKTRGKYYLGEAGEISEDDLQYLLDTATGSLRPAVAMLKKRAERELRARLEGKKVDE